MMAALASLIIKIIFGKDWCILMAMFFAQRVILGKTAYADVPAVLRPQVKELLEESGLGELVTE